MFRIAAFVAIATILITLLLVSSAEAATRIRGSNYSATITRNVEIYRPDNAPPVVYRIGRDTITVTAPRRNVVRYSYPNL